MIGLSLLSFQLSELVSFFVMELVELEAGPWPGDFLHDATVQRLRWFSSSPDTFPKEDIPPRQPDGGIREGRDAFQLVAMWVSG